VWTQKLGFSTGCDPAATPGQRWSPSRRLPRALCGGRFRLGIGAAGKTRSNSSSTQRKLPQSRRRSEEAGAGHAEECGPTPARRFKGRWNTSRMTASTRARFRNGPVCSATVIRTDHRGIAKIRRWLDAERLSGGSDRARQSLASSPPERTGRARPRRSASEVGVSMGSGNEAEWSQRARVWKQAGASPSLPDEDLQSPPHKRISGNPVDNIGALRRYTPPSRRAIGEKKNYSTQRPQRQQMARRALRSHRDPLRIRASVAFKFTLKHYRFTCSANSACAVRRRRAGLRC